MDDYRGSIVNQFEDFKNKTRRSLPNRVPTSYIDLGGILSFIYPISSSSPNTHSLYKDFSEQTISSVDNKIIYDNEFIMYLNIWGVYTQQVTYNNRPFYINYSDHEYALKNPDIKSKLSLPCTFPENP